MANAFTYNLGYNSINPQKEADVIQQNAGWVVSFFPFLVRDSKHVIPSPNAGEAVKTREPFIVINDCVKVQVSHDKGSPFGQFEGTFRSGDINYLTAIAPGDIVMVWMNADIHKLTPVIDSIKSQKAANDFNSGLKFVGRVEAVREILQVDARGTKQLIYMITAHSFQEFNTRLFQNYFGTKDGSNLTATVLFQNLRDDWQNVIKELNSEKYKTSDNVQRTVRALLNVTMGVGPGETITDPIKATPNDSFILPRIVGQVLGRSKKEKSQLKFTDVLTLIQGIQKYGGGTKTPNDPKGFMPIKLTNTDSSGTKRQYETGIKCQGSHLNLSDKWSNFPIWSLLMQYTNDVINEMYTALRVDLDGRIVPMLIMRQIPFTNELNDAATTPFLTLPRWKPHPAQVLGHNIGRSNALRVNYVQIDGDMSISNVSGQGAQVISASQSPQFDTNDIKRSGLRTLIKTSPFDFPVGDGASQAPTWSRRVADWSINGHLKLNGSVQMVGITEPICVGDNFEWDGVVYHIEKVSHSCMIQPNGVKNFRTTVDLSNGITVGGRYPRMSGEFREDLAAGDKEGIFPGYTDVQEIGHRDKGEMPSGRGSEKTNPLDSGSVISGTKTLLEKKSIATPEGQTTTKTVTSTLSGVSRTKK